MKNNLLDKLSSSLKDILEAEIALGNQIDHVIEGKSGLIGITLKYPPHVKAVRDKLKNSSYGKKYHEYSNKMGYQCINTRDYIEYVIPLDGIKEKLSPKLLPILELELSLGNRIVEAIDNPWSNVPYGVYLKNTLHKKEVDKTPLEKIRYIHDKTSTPFFGQEESYQCLETNHIIAHLFS